MRRSKICFITYIDQDNTGVKVRFFDLMEESLLTSYQSRMVYASSRETLKNALNGIAMNWQANDSGELEWADLLKEASKGKSTV